MQEFVDRVIGSTIIVRYLDGNPDERDRFICIIKTIEQQDDNTYLVTTKVGFQFTIPNLQTLIDVLDGIPYYAVNTDFCKVIIEANK